MELLKKYLFIVLLGLLSTISCSDNNEDIGGGAKDDLELLSTFDVAIAEPSGLAINSTGTTLYTVSDNTAKVYKLSTKGEVIKTFGYTGDDLEGVSTFKGVKLLLAEERTKELVEFDMGSGTFLKHKIRYDNKDSNSGIEGVAYAENLNAIFITVLAEYDLNFAKDYSGVFYDNSSKDLWIVSDQSKTINKCTIKGDVIKSYSINITQAEGIAISNNKIYVISDAEAKLYIYKLPQ